MTENDGRALNPSRRIQAGNGAERMSVCAGIDLPDPAMHAHLGGWGRREAKIRIVTCHPESPYERGRSFCRTDTKPDHSPLRWLNSREHWPSENSGFGGREASPEQCLDRLNNPVKAGCPLRPISAGRHWVSLLPHGPDVCCDPASFPCVVLYGVSIASNVHA